MAGLDVPRAGSRGLLLASLILLPACGGRDELGRATSPSGSASGPRAVEVVSRIPVGGDPIGIAEGFGSVWVVNAESSTAGAPSVARMEQLQNAIVPINLVVFAAFFISIGAVQDPDSTIARISSLLPISSALAMPVRMVLGSATPWEVALALAIVIASTALLIPFAGRVYAGAILRTGSKVRLRDAWRAAA